MVVSKSNPFIYFGSLVLEVTIPYLLGNSSCLHCVLLQVSLGILLKYLNAVLLAKLTASNNLSSSLVENSFAIVMTNFAAVAPYLVLTFSLMWKAQLVDKFYGNLSSNAVFNPLHLSETNIYFL